MTPHRWKTIEAVFDEAADLPATARPAFLEAACRTPDGEADAALREEVERLLALDAGADAFFGRLRDDLAPPRSGGRPAPRPPAASRPEPSSEPRGG